MAKASKLFFSALVLSLWWISCAGLSPVQAETALYTSEAGTPETLTPVWASLDQGIDYFEASTFTPPLEIRALRINLSDPAVSIVTNEPGPGFGVIPSIKTTSFVREFGCAAAINAGPFSPSSTKEGEDRQVIGIAVSRGRIIAAPAARYAALVFYKDRSAAIVQQREITNMEEIEHALGGFFIVLKDGALPENIPDARKDLRFSRSAAGLSGDGSTLYLLTAEGRGSGDAGATEDETGRILKKLGADDGLIFDGGGSSALALRYPNGSIRTVNRPSHGGIYGLERAVATCLGIRVEKTE